ncbi:MAG: SMC-Scp complex subunit ScpB [Gammaproteobacteria bacterium]|jgi:segregation and condensation protein B|nr:SMC-Scp complex subunit ScpB [Gammaproteobacteria bacterium]
MESQQLKNIVEAALLAAGGPLTVDQLKGLFADEVAPEKSEIREQLAALTQEYADRGIEIREVASGFRVQVRQEMGQWLTKLWEERPPRYTRALMETLAIIAYRQPVTRGDIEEIRGVTVSSNIIRTLLERDWIKVVGHRDVPGKPAIFGTTRFFLDYFGLKRLDDLPPLAELAELEPVDLQLELGTADQRPDDHAEADDAAGGVDPVEVDPLAVTDEPPELLDGNAAVEPLAATETAADPGPPDDSVPDAESGSPADDDGNVASLDEARDAAAREPETDFNAERAEVVPIKKR